MPFKEFEVWNMAEVTEAVRPFARGPDYATCWFRGHASSRWQLIPSVHRFYDNLGEVKLSRRFSLAAPARRIPCPTAPDQMLCLMQHYGLPTRLLDWTGSLLAAVFFATAFETEDGEAAIWMLQPAALNVSSRHKNAGFFMLAGQECQPLLRAAMDGGEPTEDIFAVLAHEVDSRMTNQQGTFTIHGSETPLESRDDAEQYLVKFRIPQQARATFEEELWILGARRSLFFPDLANLAEELKADFRLIPRKKDNT